MITVCQIHIQNCTNQGYIYLFDWRVSPSLVNKLTYTYLLTYLLTYLIARTAFLLLGTSGQTFSRTYELLTFILFESII